MYKLRRMTAENIDGVLAVERESFSTPWTKRLFFDELENPRTVYFVCCAGEEIVGYGGMWQVADEGQITNIAVKKEHRRGGVASGILSALIDAAVESGIAVMGLEVRSTNVAAQGLYKKFGFVPVGRRKNYYREPTEDAVLMDLRPVGK